MAAHVDIVQSELEMSQSNCISVIEMQLDWDIFSRRAIERSNRLGQNGYQQFWKSFAENSRNKGGFFVDFR